MGYHAGWNLDVLADEVCEIGGVLIFENIHVDASGHWGCLIVENGQNVTCLYEGTEDNEYLGGRGSVSEEMACR